MKRHALIWMIALATTGYSIGQESEADKEFNADYDKSCAQAIAAYPDIMKPETAMFQRLVKMDTELTADDPLRYSSEKMMIMALRAAKELGISPVVAIPNAPPPKQPIINPGVLDAAKIDEFHGYRSVVIVKVEPDGIRILHEYGAAKIQIEQISDTEREHFGLNMDTATIYRQQMARQSELYRQQEALEQRQAQLALQERQAREAYAAQQRQIQNRQANDYFEAHAEELRKRYEPSAGRELPEDDSKEEAFDRLQKAQRELDAQRDERRLKELERREHDRETGFGQ